MNSSLQHCSLSLSLLVLTLSPCRFQNNFPVSMLWLWYYSICWNCCSRIFLYRREKFISRSLLMSGKCLASNISALFFHSHRMSQIKLVWTWLKIVQKALIYDHCRIDVRKDQILHLRLPIIQNASDDCKINTRQLLQSNSSWQKIISPKSFAFFALFENSNCLRSSGKHNEINLTFLCGF